MDSNDRRMKYDVDIVFCIDATGSMESIIEKVKENALTLRQKIISCMEEKHKTIDLLRARVITFRDYSSDGKENAMLTTPFYSLPEQNDDLKYAVDMIKPFGGGDLPEDGLEALCYAMHSQWMETNNKGRQIIVVFTDAGTHPLGEGPKMNMPDYPSKMPRSYGEASDMWDAMSIRKKRLIVFAPEEEYWTNIYEDWENVIYCPSRAGEGLSEVNFDEIVNVIGNSIT